MDDENKLPTSIPATIEEPNSLKADDKDGTQMENVSIKNHSSPEKAKSKELISTDELNKVSDGMKSIDLVGSIYENNG